MLKLSWQNLCSTIQRHNMSKLAEPVCSAILAGATSYFKTDKIGS